jgi:hypothetical protein
MAQGRHSPDVVSYQMRHTGRTAQYIGIIEKKSICISPYSIDFPAGLSLCGRHILLGMLNPVGIRY